MNPSRRRLPVSKPKIENESTPDSTFPQPEMAGQDTAKDISSAKETSVSRDASKQSFLQTNSPGTKLAKPFKAKTRRSSIPQAISVLGSNAQLAGDEAAVLAIQVEEEDDRPFELGDLLTRQWAARNSSFLVSFAIHTFLILLLSLFLITGTGKAIIVLEMLNSADIEEADGVMDELEVDIDITEDLVTPFDDELFNSAFGENDGEQQIADSGENPGVEGSGESRTGAGDGKSAKFFGTKAQGNKFVYVLDRSGSMDYQSGEVSDYQVTRFDVARMELIKSVESLQPHQEFYVVLFSTGMKQMFNEQSLLPKPVKATLENKARLRDWLWEGHASGGTDPRDSLKLAFKMKPDAIFMLSDGEFRDERDGDPLSIDLTRKQVADNNPIRINSIALEDDSSKANMEELSNVSGGQFRFVKVRDYIKNLVGVPGNVMFGKNALVHHGNISNWEARHQIATATISVLQSRLEVERAKAEELLHLLSYGIFERSIPTVTGPFKLSQAEKSVTLWKDAFAKANDQAVLDLSTNMGLFCRLANVGQKDFLDSVESLNATQLEPLHQIAVVKSVLSYQKHHHGGVNERSRTLLIEVLDELNKASKAKFGRDRFIKKASLQTCEQRLKKVLDNRRWEARKLLNKTKDKKTAEVDRIAIGNELISLYPESEYAIEVSENLNLPVSHVQSN